jgi:signal transduction histidine kinase
MAGLAKALASTGDRALLIATVGAACREALHGDAWRFLALDAETGALTDATPGALPSDSAASAVVVWPEAGGVLEALLAREEPAVGRSNGGGPTCDAALWDAPPRTVLGWPIASGGRLFGLLLVARTAARNAPAAAVDQATLAANQLGIALEREALRAAGLAQAAAMSGLEQRASSGEAAFSELISVVAHEIRTPLTSIKAYTEALIDAPSEEFEQRRKFLGVIDEECDRLSRLVGDALDLSRLEAGHRSLKLKTIAPAEFLADLVSTVEPEAASREVTIAVETVPGAAPEPAVAEGDTDLLKQLLLNLIGNAIKFSPTGGRITVRSRLDEAEWRLDVADEGTGIPEDQLDRIFERFYRVELRGGRRVPGTGLGLAIARHIAELHDGQVWAANGDPTGSVFSLRLPRLQRAPLAARNVARALLGRTEVRALLTDAIEMISEVMRAQIVSIVCVDPDEGDLVVGPARGLDAAARARRIPYRAGVAGAAIRAGQALLVDNIETDRRFAKKSHPQYFTKSLLTAPVIVAGEAIGVINVNNKESHEEFVEADRILLAPLVARLESALTRAYAYPDSAAVVAEARQALQAAKGSRRDLLLDRCALTRYARELSAALGLDARDAAQVERMVCPSTGPESMADLALRSAILLARGERFDGTGAPRGLAGEAIPLGARIMAALDRFESLTHGRPYRPALGRDAALAALRAERGRALDPRVVDALLALVDADAAPPAHEEAA